MLSIAIILTCHNRRKCTIRSLHKIIESSIPEDHIDISIYLVDDGSTDGTSEAVRLQYPEVKIIQGTGNLYWTRGMHLAWQTAAREADYDYYLWLNDDTYLKEDAIRILLSGSREKGDNSIIVGATCSKETGLMSYSGFLPSGVMAEPTGQLQEVDTFNGNVVLVPRSVFQILGNLDTLFQHAIGDVDYGLRAKAKGIKSYITPVYIAYCESHKTLPKWCLKEVSFVNRVRSLYSPLGNSHPYYFFRYELRHFGCLIAIKHLFTIHLRVIFPQLWK